MGRLEQLLSLSRNERSYLARAVFWLPATSVLLRLFGFRRTLAFYERRNTLTAENKPTSYDLDTATMVARMINLAARHGPFHARCLQQSLLLIKFLHASGIVCKLCLGSQRQGEKFGAHAWVECGGIAVNDDLDVKLRYAAFDSLADQSK